MNKKGWLCLANSSWRINLICWYAVEKYVFWRLAISIGHTFTRVKNLNPDIPSKTTLELHPLKSKNSRIKKGTGCYQQGIARIQFKGFYICDIRWLAGGIMDIWRFFNRIANDVGIKGATFRTILYTFATRGIESGIDILVLSKIFGHANPEPTLKPYGYILAKNKRNSM